MCGFGCVVSQLPCRAAVAALLTLGVLAPLAAQAQQPAKLPRVA